MLPPVVLEGVPGIKMAAYFSFGVSSLCLDRGGDIRLNSIEAREGLSQI